MATPRFIASGRVREAPSVLDLQHALFFGINLNMDHRWKPEFLVEFTQPVQKTAQVTVYVRQIARADLSDEGTLFLVQGLVYRIAFPGDNTLSDSALDFIIGKPIAIRYRVKDRHGDAWVLTDGALFDSPLIRMIFEHDVAQGS